MKNLLLSAILLPYCVACQGQKQREFICFKPLTIKSLSVSDSIGSWPLEPSPGSPTQVRIKLNDKHLKADAIDSHFLVIKNAWEIAHVLYRASVVDTTWLELGGLLGRYPPQEVKIQQPNLDGKSQPEALLTFTKAVYGNSGNSYSTSIYLLDVGAYPPRLLLQANTGFIDETFRLVNQKIYSVYTGYERTVGLRPDELVIGPTKARGKQSEPHRRNALTQLPSGRYHYQHGRLYHVGP